MTRCLRAIVIVPLMLQVACQGLIEGPTGPGTSTGIGAADGSTPGSSISGVDPLRSDVKAITASAECKSGTAGVAAPLRALTRTQYANTIRDLFGGQVTASTSFPQAQGASLTGFSSDSTVNAISGGYAEGLATAADDVALQVMGKLTTILPCASSRNRACADTFVTTYATKAFRRPVAAEEKTALLAHYDGAMAEHNNFNVAIAELTSTILQHPLFVYLPEIGTLASGQRKLDDYELASRLSFLLTDTLPDAALLSAAQAGQLSTDAGLKTQTTRLIASDAFKAVLGRFVREWMHLKDVKPGDKDPTLFPEFDATLASSMSQEFDRFVLNAVRKGAGGFEALIAGRDTFVNAPLAALYGATTTSKSAEEWVPATLESERSGLLTRAAVLASYAGPTEPQHIFRGKFIRTGLLCDRVGAPPPGANASQPAYPAGSTRRQRSEILQSTQPCGGCHKQMDAIGLGFDNFDAIGQREAGNINVSGNIIGTDEVAGEFRGAAELATVLAGSDQVKECIGRQWFRYSFGRVEGAADSCTYAKVATDLGNTNGDLGAMFASITSAGGFRFRKTVD